MILNITAKNLSVSGSVRDEIEDKVDKISRLLPHLAADLAQLKINLKSRKRNFYRMKLSLSVPGDYLTVRLNKQTIGGTVKEGFDNLLEQVKRYRERHFKSLSRYPGRDSIRKGEELWIKGLSR